ncbi:MAG: hypothetical protein GXW99_01085 [Clostridiales bacterium]|nr:hypothetical protein [Clostridiales bacterium]
MFQEEMLTEEPAPVAAAAPKESVREDVCRLQGRLARLEEQLQKMRVIIGAQRIEEEEPEAETEKTMALCVPAQEKTSLWQSIKRLLRELFSV